MTGTRLLNALLGAALAFSSGALAGIAWKVMQDGTWRP